MNTTENLEAVDQDRRWVGATASVGKSSTKEKAMGTTENLDAVTRIADWSARRPATPFIHFA